MPKTYYNKLYVQIQICDQNNFARVTSVPKKPIWRHDLSTTCYKNLVLARGEFLRLVGDQNKSLRVIIIYYMLEYTFGIKITLLES